MPRTGTAPWPALCGDQLLERSQRMRTPLSREAQAGTTLWTSRAAAERFGVTQVTALAGLNALIREGALRVDGAGSKRRYRAG